MCGEVFILTKYVDAYDGLFLDRGSTPLASTINKILNFDIFAKRRWFMGLKFFKSSSQTRLNSSFFSPSSLAKLFKFRAIFACDLPANFFSTTNKVPNQSTLTRQLKKAHFEFRSNFA